jgi:NADH:ubiquinone oxidoreductase subunit 6 (subunit J)
MMLLAAINWHSVMFLLFALLACGFALAVLATSNIVRMAFFLTLSLGATSGLFFLAGAEFLGAMQLMIYVGGTLVLLIFGVMLTAQERFISMKTSAGELILGAIVGASLFLLLLRAGLSVGSWSEPNSNPVAITLADAHTSTPIGLALTGVRVDKLDVGNSRLKPGMSGYLLPFVIVSMHLLVVLIGAGYMARTKRVATGLALERPLVAPVPRDRKRRFLVSAGLIKGIVIDLLLALGCFLLAAQASSSAEASGIVGWFQTSLAHSPAWFLPLLGLLFLVHALVLYVVYSWQKWGVVGLVLVSLGIILCLMNANVAPLLAAIVLLIAVVPTAILISMVVGLGSPTMWSQMD